MATQKKTIKKKVKRSRNPLPFIKKYESDLVLVIIPVILLVIFQILSIVVNGLAFQTNTQQLATHSFLETPSDFTFFDRPITPDITAEAAIIMDRDSKTVLYQKNADLRFSMASTTKIMTALVALGYFKPDDILTAYTSHVEGVNVGVEVGDKLYFKDALYAMLLPSGND
nr:D-alanyl-D-alanine carboxypeptidase [Patescibacteria group bacterium]